MATKGPTLEHTQLFRGLKNC